MVPGHVLCRLYPPSRAMTLAHVLLQDIVRAVVDRSREMGHLHMPEGSRTRKPSAQTWTLPADSVGEVRKWPWQGQKLSLLRCAQHMSLAIQCPSYPHFPGILFYRWITANHQIEHSHHIHLIPPSPREYVSSLSQDHP